MRHFSGPKEIAAITREREHEGEGPIHFRRLLTKEDFGSPIDFIDLTTIPPGSSIGLHEHHSNEEAYLILAGNPLIEAGSEKRRLAIGDVVVVHSGEAHSLINDTETDVQIFVIQVRLKEP